MMKILLADRNDLLRLGFQSVFATHTDGTHVDEAANHSQLMKSIKDENYDLLVIDPVSFGGTGETLLRQLKECQPRLNILVYTVMEEMVFGVRVIRSGAKGFLMKTSSKEELITAAYRVAAGRMYITPTLAEQFAAQYDNRPLNNCSHELTDREFLVFSMLVCGKRIGEIACLLNLSGKTVSTHKTRLLRKLNVSSLSDMVQYAMSKGLMEDCRARCAESLYRRAA